MHNLTNEQIKQIFEAKEAICNGDPLKDVMDQGEVEHLVIMIAVWLESHGYHLEYM